MQAHLLLLLFGLAILYFGAELVVRGSVRLARAYRVRPLIVGVTVVAFGGSVPELFVSALASGRGEGDLALGNVIGSNIANIGLVLGISAMLRSIPMEMRLVTHELPILIVVTVSTVLLGGDGALGRGDGVLLLAGFLVFVAYVGRTVRRGPPELDVSTQQIVTVREVRLRRDGRVWSMLTVVAGLGLLITGAEVLVDAAGALALALGVSEVVIGLTTVALGTSLPEMVTSAVAVLRGAPDLALGNVVGSNIFNCLAVLGLGSIIRPLMVGAPLFTFEIPVMLVLTALLWLLARTGRDIDRLTGAGLVAAYVFFLLVVAIRAA